MHGALFGTDTYLQHLLGLLGQDCSKELIQEQIPVLRHITSAFN